MHGRGKVAKGSRVGVSKPPFTLCPSPPPLPWGVIIWLKRILRGASYYDPVVALKSLKTEDTPKIRKTFSISFAFFVSLLFVRLFSLCFALEKMRIKYRVGSRQDLDVSFRSNHVALQNFVAMSQRLGRK